MFFGGNSGVGGIPVSEQGEFRCQSMFFGGNSGVGGIPGGNSGVRATFRVADDHDGAAHRRCEAMGNDLDPVLCTVGPATAHRRPLRTDDRTPSNALAGCSPRTFRRQRARRSGSVRPSCSHSGNESRMGSACPAPWQRWLDQVDSHGSATIAAHTGLASMYLRTTSRWSPSWMTGDRRRPCHG